MKKVTVGIVTYNSEDEISEVLNSIYSSNTIEELDVFVSDNNSTDNTVNVIEKNYPQVHLIKNKENFGFGKAHNQIINLVDSKYHIIVNPDIKFDKNIIKELTSIMDINPNYTILSPHIIGEDGESQYLPKKKPKLKYILSGKLENRSSFFKKLREEYTMKNEEICEMIEIDFCTGCFMFTRTKILKLVNGFDERYFLHFEDADLTLKMKKYGKTIYVPNVEITHKWHRDNIRNSQIQKIAIKSMFKFLKKWGMKNV